MAVKLRAARATIATARKRSFRCGLPFPPISSAGRTDGRIRRDGRRRPSRGAERRRRSSSTSDTASGSRRTRRCMRSRQVPPQSDQRRPEDRRRRAVDPLRTDKPEFLARPERTSFFVQMGKVAEDGAPADPAARKLRPRGDGVQSLRGRRRHGRRLDRPQFLLASARRRTAIRSTSAIRTRWPATTASRNCCSRIPIRS